MRKEKIIKTNIRRKKIIIGCIVILILIIISGIYFLKNNDKGYYCEPFEEKISNIYICDNSGSKYYSLENDNDVDCNQVDFECKNCSIINNYIKDKIVYLNSKSQIIVYDLNNKEVVKTINTNAYKKCLFSLDIYAENDEFYGFAYVDEKTEKSMFYNINNNKTFELPEGNISLIKDSKTEDDNLYYHDVIHNDRVIIKRYNSDYIPNTSSIEYYYGILNLSNGKLEIPIDKTTITYDFYENQKMDDSYSLYYLIGEDYGYNASVFDENFNLIYKFEEKSDSLANLLINTLKYYGGDKLLIYQDNYRYFSIINKDTGERYFKLYEKDINKEIFTRIENNELKSKIDKELIVSEMDFENDITYFYNYDEQIFYISFYYSNDDYQTYVSLHYKYDFKTNILESFEYEEDNYEECGEE